MPVWINFSEDSRFLDNRKSWLHRVGWLATHQGLGGGAFAGDCFGRTDEKVSQSGAGGRTPLPGAAQLEWKDRKNIPLSALHKFPDNTEV